MRITVDNIAQAKAAAQAERDALNATLLAQGSRWFVLQDGHPVKLPATPERTQ